MQRAGRYIPAHAKIGQAQGLLGTIEYGPIRTEVLLNEASLLDDLGRYQDAEARLREALALATRWRQWSMVQSVASQLLFVVGWRNRRMVEALRYRELAEGLLEMRTSSGSTPATPNAAAATTMRNVGMVLRMQGKYEEAEAQFRRALQLARDSGRPNAALVTNVLNNLAGVLLKRGELAEAERVQRRAIAAREGALGAAHPDVAAARLNLAGILYTQKKFAEAEQQMVQALARLEAVMGASHPAVMESRANLGMLLRAEGKLDEAEQLHRRAIASLLNSLGAEHPLVSSARINLAAVLLDQGKIGQGLVVAELAWERNQRDDLTPAERGHSAQILAELRWRLAGSSQERAEAIALAQTALAAYTEAGDGFADRVEVLELWLREHPLQRA